MHQTNFDGAIGVKLRKVECALQEARGTQPSARFRRTASSHTLNHESKGFAQREMVAEPMDQGGNLFSQDLSDSR